MKQREKSFMNTVLLVLPYIWSFFTQSDLNGLLKLNIVCPLILTVLFVAGLADKRLKKDNKIYKCLIFFSVFCLYALTVCIFNKDAGFMFSILLTMSTMFSYIYLGYDIKTFGFIGYAYAAISVVVLIDYVSGGLTAGWNPNSIGMIGINGAYYLFLSIELEDRKFVILKLMIIALIVYLITIPDCRSVLFGFAMFVLIRYIVYLKRKISKGYYYFSVTLLTLLPYFIMQFYINLSKSDNVDKINQFFFKYTGKILFTERELIWDEIKQGLKGVKYWFGTGKVHANAHNIIMDIWYTIGLVGVALFCFMIIFFFTRVHKYFSDPILKMSVCCFYGMWFSQIFECAFFTNTHITFNPLMYIFVAIVFGRYLKLKANEKQYSRNEGIPKYEKNKHYSPGL